MNKLFVDYVIRDYTKPMGVATYKTADEMPENLRKALPPVEELRRLLDGEAGNDIKLSRTTMTTFLSNRDIDTSAVCWIVPQAKERLWIATFACRRRRSGWPNERSE